MRSIDKIRRRNVHMSSVRRRVSILSLSLSYFFHQFVNRESTRFTNGATVEDDARLAPGEKDRGGSSWEETGLEINSVSCILVWFPDGFACPTTGYRPPRPISFCLERYTDDDVETRAISSHCFEIYDRIDNINLPVGLSPSAYTTTILYFAKYTGTTRLSRVSTPPFRRQSFSNFDGKHLQNIS